MKRTIMSLSIIFCFIFITCSDLEHTNPADPKFILEAPTNLTAEAIDDQSIQLTWTDNCEFESGYRVERNEGSGFINITELNADVTTYKDEGLTYGKSYTYRIKAYTGQNESDYSNEFQVEMIIPIPTNLTATAIDDQSLWLTWTDNCSYESGYRIERSDGSGYMAVSEVNADSTNYIDEGLTYGQTYIYRVKAYTDRNESDYSNLISIDMIINAPSNLTAEIIDDQSIKLTWQDNCNFEAGYKLERKDEGESFIEITQLSENTTEYTDESLTYGQPYTYRIKSYTTQNESFYSNDFQIKLFISAPNGFVYVPNGSFTMGDVWGDGVSSEYPTHEVTVSSYYMSKYEVTQELCQSVMGNNPSIFTKNDQDPVEKVTWYYAVEFCNALSEQEGLTPCYIIDGNNTTCNFNANGYRLPTEAEWEYAARSGGRDDRKYSGTNNESELGNYAWYGSNSDGKTHPVGTKQPNDLGIYDMSGNVYEWCWDWYNSYPSSSQINPTGHLTGNNRVYRGGSWLHHSAVCRSAHRNSDLTSKTSWDRGFRILRTF